MALATQCPHCGTMFRVAADQLKLRGGIVRCGACTEIFDGNAALVDLASAAPRPSPRRRRASDADTALTPAPAAAPQPEAPAAPAPEADEDPIYTLEFDRAFSPYGILPQASSGDEVNEAAPVADAVSEPAAAQSPADEVQPEPVAEPAPEASAELIPDATPEAAPEPVRAPEPASMAQASADAPAALAVELQVDEELVAAPAPDQADFPEQPASVSPSAPALAAAPAPAAPKAAVPPLLLRESGPATVTMPAPPSAPPVAPRTPRTRAAEARAARKSKLTPTRIEPPKLRVPEPDEPEFVRRGRQRERSGKAMRIAMLAGSVLLLLVLAAQVVMHFRTPLAARYPGLKPTLVSLCGVLGCRVELPARIDQLVIDTGELTTLGGNAYTFSTQLRNQGDSIQAWPSIELTLSDADDKPLVRRVFGPRDYLPAGPLLGLGFAAHAEQPVKLHFRVAEPAPSGYHIAVFYP
ncbi:zinc-ribbon and DUF3426 domain-containing protein [Massilia sp. LC238]|uniref:zinc-ribbon and DUF3426 domain-containing protein n=1 Tax=Massilia sp. LC238 TaxID=1502852 RepID=UPI0004E42673|nr:zinc-ribbon and DUF3426 domain-containing protein [Massilia sp. LC238]KFC64291.1 family finger-like domain-containing protein [Massilia sp. LC238]